MVTTRDVAKQAGVSTSTVSHVLNETRVVSADLRGRVLAAMEDLGYEPNAVARSLKIKRSHSLGLVLSDISNPFFTDVARGVEDVAKQNGYTVFLANSHEDPAEEEAYLRVLSSRQVDGLILSPTGGAHEYLVRLARSGFPLIFIDREVGDLGVPAVMLDNRAAARDAVRHLLALGHRRIAFVSGRSQISSTQERLEGYTQALAEAGIPLNPSLVASGGSRMEEARTAVSSLLRINPAPTAFFVANNLMTIGALAGIQDSGRRVPDDIALVGFDDFSWADVFRPRLTTVAQPTYQLGRTAAELLLQRIGDRSATVPRRIVLPGELIVRESSGAFRPMAPLAASE